MSKILLAPSHCTIDSLQIRVPLSDVESYSDSLTDNTYLVSSSGEVLEEREANRRHWTPDKALSMQVKRVRHSGSENLNCLQLTATSKLLGLHYLDGITSQTFGIVYDAIVGTGLVNLSYDSLLTQGVATDLDVKKDSYFPSDVDFAKYCKELEKASKPTRQIARGCKRYNNREQGRGIQFGIRKSATAAYPFLKLYDKRRELLTKSLDFAKENVLSVYDTERLVRTEATAKNREAFKRVLGTSDNSLGSALRLSPQALQKFIQHAVNVHIEKVTAPHNRETSNNLTGMKLGIYRWLESSLDSGVHFLEFSDTYLQRRSKKDRQRSKALLSELHTMYLNSKKTSSESPKMESLLFGAN
mgnify:CR=1 FL=1